MLQNDPIRLPPFHFDADPDPAFHFNADPDPNSQNYVDPCGHGSDTLLHVTDLSKKSTLRRSDL